MESFWDYLPFDAFFNPDKRVYWPFLSLCGVYALLYFWFTRQKIKISKDYWLHPSAVLDYKIWLINFLLQVTLIPLVFVSGFSFASSVYHFLLAKFGFFSMNTFSFHVGLIFYCLAYLLISDFTRYLLHWLMHKSFFFWRFHRLHHSAEVLTPLTFFRIHPIEMILAQARFLVVYGLITGLFMYFFNEVYYFPKLFGISFFVFLSNILGANLRHSHIPIPFGWMEHVFLSPKQHQMHHSKDAELQDSNLGSMFAFWDKWFGTWKSSSKVDKIDFGVRNYEGQSLKDELLYPLTAKKKKSS